MKHFSDEAWIDFARGVASSSKVAELNLHLNQCTECRRISELWSAVMEIARRDEEYRPSETATRSAKAMFGLSRALENPTRAKAHLIFDSFRSPLTAGIRNSNIASQRQLQYEFGPIMVDIEINQDPGGENFLSGQISSREEDRHVDNCRVFLIRGRRFTAQMRCSRLGEFDFDLTDGRNWKLLIEAPEIILLSLPDVISRQRKR
jgi:hypothetical protein